MLITIYSNFYKRSIKKGTTLCDLPIGYFSRLLGITLILFIQFANAKSPLPICSSHLSTTTQIVKLGMSTALSGPLQYNGIPMSEGVLKKIDEANCDTFWRNKGIQFELKILDDSYDPDTAANNTRILIKKEKVIALVGNVGTPTAEKTWKIANESRVVFYGALSGSTILRLKPPAPYVFNYRPGYDQELNSVVNNIIDKGIPITAIGVLFQNDAFGKSGLESLHKALEKKCGECKNRILLMHYERNNLKTNKALQEFITFERKPKAIILIATLEPMTEFIRFAQRLAPSSQFYGLSTIDAINLRKKLNGHVNNISLSQFLPKKSNVPISEKVPITENTITLSAAYQEGYLATELLIDSMRTINGPITSESLRNSLIVKERTLPGDPNDHQMISTIWLMPLHDEKADTIEIKKGNLDVKKDAPHEQL